MAAMTGAFDLRRAGAKRPGNRWGSIAGWFRLVALLEAVSWVGLLVGMYFKYLASTPTEVGVKVFGMAHGLIFVGFVVVAVLAGIAFKWTIWTWLLAAIGSIVPLGSVIFLIWADRTGKMGVAAPAAAIVRPGQPVPETT